MHEFIMFLQVVPPVTCVVSDRQAVDLSSHGLAKKNLTHYFLVRIASGHISVYEHTWSNVSQATSPSGLKVHKPPKRLLVLYLALFTWEPIVHFQARCKQRLVLRTERSAAHATNHHLNTNQLFYEQLNRLISLHKLYFVPVSHPTLGHKPNSNTVYQCVVEASVRGHTTS